MVRAKTGVLDISDSIVSRLCTQLHEDDNGTRKFPFRREVCVQECNELLPSCLVLLLFSRVSHRVAS